VVYGSITGTSVGELFIAGIGSGIVYGGATLGYCFYRAWRDRMQPLKPASFMEIIHATIAAIWTLGVPGIILGGIYFGILTPTEAAGISVIYALLVSVLVYRELGWKEFFQVSLESAILSAELMLLTGAASALGWVSTIGQLPQLMFSSLLSFTSSPYVFFILANILLLIMGMFIDGVPAVVIVAPLLAPLAQKLGINLVHLGIVLTANMAIGMFTAPFGLNLFVAADITHESFERVAVDCVPFIIVSIIGLLFLTYLPEISLWLPRLVYGKVG
jgi:C4-dicarboxylate transporter DctM subunit